MSTEINLDQEGLAELESLLANEQALNSVDGLDVYMQLFAWASVGLNIYYVITFLLTAWGLYMINKKLGEKHPWLSFIPVVQVYTYFVASQKSFLKYFVYPLIALIVGIALAAFTFGISAIAATIYMMYCWVIVLHAISKRTGRWAWSTVGMLFVWFIILPVIGHKLKEWTQSWWEELPSKDTSQEL